MKGNTRLFVFGSAALLFASRSYAQAPDPYSSNSKISYIRTWDALSPEINANSVMANPVEYARQSTAYLNGMGQVIQSVTKQGSVVIDPVNPNNVITADLVFPKVFDEGGREKYMFMPFVANNTNGNTSINDGNFKFNPFEQQLTFMNGQHPGEENFYGTTLFDQSPLNRPLKSMMPGASYVGSNRGQEIQYKLNNAIEGIRIWNIGFATNGVPYSTAIYTTGKLSKTISLDEKLKKTYTYLDNEGRIVLKKVQDNELGQGLDENGHDGWLCTYYVYDDMSQLRVTITPKAVKYLQSSSWTFSSEEVYQELCFWYEYDSRGRAIVKHTPGGGQLQYVYDNKDRLVLSQDENQRSRSTKQWTFFLYDNLDRPIASGLFDNNATRDAMADYVRNLNAGVIQITIFTGSNETLRADNPVAGTGGNCNGCSNTVINTVNYYDDYLYAQAKNFNSNFAFASTSNPYVEQPTQGYRIISFPTGSKIRVIDQNFDDNNPVNDIFLVSTAYYDDKGRSIQDLTDNIKGGLDFATKQYDFSGKILSVNDNHSMPGTSFSGFQIISKFEYDKLGRITLVSKKYGANEYKKIVSFKYGVSGQLAEKKISPDFNGSVGLESFLYDYNLHGQLQGINKSYALSTSSLSQWDHYFGFYIGFDNRDNQFTAPQYNGNSTGQLWKTQGDNMPRRYDYQYDNLNRLTVANFLQKEKPSDMNWGIDKADFSVNNILYDENSNLLQMFQKGITPGNNNNLFVDKLVYEYKQVAGAFWSNQLKRVFDQTTDLTATNNGGLGDFKDESYGVNVDDYEYDGNGNIVRDNNKKIRVASGPGVVYNFMDKPQKITIEGKSIIEFIYDASGIKLGKKVTMLTSNSVKTTWYAGDYIYEESNSQFQLSYILHEEGRIRAFQPSGNPRISQSGYFDLPGTNTKGVFEYFLKDHLENVRMVLTEESHSELNNCTMEISNSLVQDYEQRMFGQVDPSTGNPNSNNEVIISRVDKSEAAGWNSNTSIKASKLIQTGQKIGPNMFLKVMAGDMLHTQTDYYYTGTVDNTGVGNLFTPLLNSVVGALSGSVQASGNVKDAASVINSNFSANPGDLNNYLNNQQQGGSTPQAYLNILFFDENFRFVAYDNVTGLGSYGWRVTNSGDNQYLSVPNVKVPKNGYAYIYLSNESKTAVYFDNFVVNHVRGKIIEENAYYPYGLKIKGICAKAFDKPDNNFDYQGSFGEEESESNWVEFTLRMYDPQIGRWIGVDPYDQFASPYIGMADNPANFVDPNGGQAGTIGAILGAVSGFTAGYLIARNNNGSPFWWGLLGSGVGAGFGYGLSETLFGNGVGIGANIRAFYKALVGGTGPVNTMWDGYNDPLNHFQTQVEIPTIWGGREASVESITTVTGPTITGLPLVANLRGLPLDRITINIPESNPPQIKLTKLCPCINVPIRTPGRSININYSNTGQDSYAYADSRISDEEYNGILDLISQVRNGMQAGDLITNLRLIYSPTLSDNMPLNLVPAPVKGAMVNINPQTGRRKQNSENYTYTNVGVSVLFNLNSQLNTLSGIVQRRLGVSPTPTLIPISSNKIAGVYKLQLTGILIRPPAIKYQRRCPCLEL